MQVCLPLRSGYEAVVTNQATGRRHGIGVDVSIEWRSFHDHVAILEFWLQAGLIFDFGLVSMVLLCWVRRLLHWAQSWGGTSWILEHERDGG